MVIENKHIFNKNLDYLYNLAKKAGFKKQDVNRELNIDNSMPHYWKKRGRIGQPNLNKLVKFFQSFVDFDLTEKLLLTIDLEKYTNTSPYILKDRNSDYQIFTEEEKEMIYRLRRWHPVNRQAIIEFIRNAKL